MAKRDRHKNPRMGDRYKPRQKPVDLRTGWLRDLQIGDRVLVRDAEFKLSVTAIAAITPQGHFKTTNDLFFPFNGINEFRKKRLERIVPVDEDTDDAKKKVSALYTTLNRFFTQDGNLREEMYKTITKGDIVNLNIAMLIVNALILEKGK